MGGEEEMTWVQIEKFVAGLLGIINIGFGVAVLGGGAVRFPPPTYEPLLRFTGDQVWPYGLVFLFSGVAMLLPEWRVRFGGVVASVLIHDVFASLFLVAVVRFADAGGTAWWAYFCFGAQSAILAALIWWHRMRGSVGGG